MRIDILTIFPEMFVGPLTESLLKKARDKGILSITITDFRSFAADKHHSVDDRPFGGGPGMVMKPEPIFAAFKALGVLPRKKRRKQLVVALTPQGRTFTQGMAKELAGYDRLVLLCGHYEGFDERVMDWIDDEISIGDYVLTGGELPAMVLIDTVARLLPGVVKESGSVEHDSFFHGLLDYPQYTRPPEFKGKAVPNVLLSGDHKAIERWRREQALRVTASKRPDLLKKAALTADEKKLVRTFTKRRAT